jgi:hypothetical protein
MDDAMISGLAPGSDAPTVMVGKSTCGKGETGSCLKATTPAKATADVSSVVATGRRMNGDERPMLVCGNGFRPLINSAMTAESLREPVEVDIDDRSGVER